jgi:hypothetical protein
MSRRLVAGIGAIGMAVAVLAGPASAAGDAPPRGLGTPVVSVVPLWQLNSPYYVSARHFPTVGQSIALTRPIRLTAVVPHMSDRTTLLTPEGIQIMDTPGAEEAASQQTLERVEITQFRRNYEIPTRLTTRIYRHDGPIPANFDIFDGSFTLEASVTARRVIRTGNPLVVRFPDRPLLEAGYYLVVFAFDDLPRKVLTLFISGREEGLRGQDQVYPFGRPYYADAETPGVFQEGLFKYSGAGDTDWGEDNWCRGDIQMWVFGDLAPGPGMTPERTTGNPMGPRPDKGRCWRPGSKP